MLKKHRCSFEVFNSTLFNMALKLAARDLDVDNVEQMLDSGAVYNPMWTGISDEMREFIANYKPLCIKSAAKIS